MTHLLLTRHMEDFVTWVDTSKLKRTIMRYNDEVSAYSCRPVPRRACSQNLPHISSMTSTCSDVLPGDEDRLAPSVAPTNCPARCASRHIQLRRRTTPCGYTREHKCLPLLAPHVSTQYHAADTSALCGPDAELGRLEPFGHYRPRELLI